MDHALELARHYADGGMAQPWYERQELRDAAHVGPISSPVGGRTDHIGLKVLPGSYVLPADVVSGLPGAEGNTDAGVNILQKMWGQNPYHAAQTQIRRGAGVPIPRAPLLQPGANWEKPQQIGARAKGGQAPHGGGLVPIKAAGGEFVLHPDLVRKIGHGDLNHGHKTLDHFVKMVRHLNVKTLRKLPGPARK